MTLLQRALLEAVKTGGGVHDRYGRIVAEGMTFHSTAALWCFLRGWITVKRERIVITGLGLHALASNPAISPRDG